MVGLNFNGKHIDLGSLKKHVPNKPSANKTTPKSQPKSMPKKQISPTPPKKDLIIFGEKIDSEFIKRELNFFIVFVKTTKAGKVLVGILSFLFLLSLIYFLILSGLPIVLRILFFLLTLIIITGAFILEIILLHKKQLLVGVYVTDLYYATAKKVYATIEKNNPDRKSLKAPWLLTQFKLLLRFTFPFFKRVTKEEYAKMTLEEKKKYLKSWETYVAKVKKIREQQKREAEEMQKLKIKKQQEQKLREEQKQRKLQESKDKLAKSSSKDKKPNKAPKSSSK
ncbi:hypothetical protein JXM83_03245 [Candidatus Woesearchaeota archaeon]|nr:hypothetical protein [Candidatus Woesearchaeota archaeon]